jgi:hypothetical protein
MRFDMFEILGPGFFRAKPKIRPSVKGVAVIPKRPPLKGTASSAMAPTEISNLGQPCGDPENRAFRALDRHTRWATVHELSHLRAPQ